MNGFLYQLVIASLLSIAYIVVGAPTTFAQFDPLEKVTLTMFRLNQEGNNAGSITQPPTPCTKDELEIAQSYVCTAIPEGPNRTSLYPFESSTITISIDGSDGPDNDVYVYPYLWDVVPQELDMNGSQGNKPLAAVEAQMIAARTYIYQRMTYIDQYGTPNNSTQFHVFLPYRYRALTPPQRVRVQAAAAKRFYMTESNSTYPLEALYGADNPADTIEGNRPYLKSVFDPISAAYGTLDGTANGGMSSKGASRWSYGHTSSRGPVASDHPYYPHDDGNNGDFWSVRWNDALQILTHYYSGIHIRDANNNNDVVTPNQRWVPLWMRWNLHSNTPPTSTCAGHAILLEVLVQNSGTETWPAGGAVTFEAVTSQGLQLQSAAVDGAAFPPEPVPPGGTYTATLLYQAPANEPNGYLTQIYFEMAEGATGFSQQNKAWPDFSIEVTIPHCNAHAYLPLIERETQPSIQ
ncbi:MAG: hypothetical protein R2911_20310 [Caldilineaceae bacterium]